MASYNDITGNCLVTKPSTDAYRAGFDAIFGSKEKKETPVFPELPVAGEEKEEQKVDAEPTISMKDQLESTTKIRFVSGATPDQK
jgi:hypothetical protein